ncbi:MAG: hypothetical protein AB8B51_05555 [Sedimentitalea sp.]
MVLTLCAALVLPILAGPTLALTPLPPRCAYDGSFVDGDEIIEVWNEANGFVTYSTQKPDTRSVYFLEHCPSGKILRATSGPYSLPASDQQSAENLWDVMNAALVTPEPVTMGEIQRLLRAQGIRTNRYTSKSESCACQSNWPDARGSKTPYERASQ